MIASAGEWKPQQEQLVQVGDYTCKKLRAPRTLSSGELFCGIDGSSQLLLDVALRTEPPTIQSITYNLCSTEEPFRVSERVYQEYRITNGLKEMNPVVWGPDYKLDSRTTLNIGYSGQPCSEGRGYELKLHDYHIRKVNSKNWQERLRQTGSRRKRKS